MKDDASIATRSSRVWLSADQCKLDDFKQIVGRQTNLADYPLAQAVQSNVLIYDCAAIRSMRKVNTGGCHWLENPHLTLVLRQGALGHCACTARSLAILAFA